MQKSGISTFLSSIPLFITLLHLSGSATPHLCIEITTIQHHIMKQRHYQLEASWDDLFSASVGCVSRLLPGCDRLDRLVHTVNGIARATESLNAGCVDMLDECRETFMWLIPRCSKIGYLVNAARCIARVMKRFGLDWSSLLDECRIRLMQLLPECEELAAAVRVINCIVEIAPLISLSDTDNAPSAGTTDDTAAVSSPETPVAVLSRSMETPSNPMTPPAMPRGDSNVPYLLRSGPE